MGRLKSCHSQRGLQLGTVATVHLANLPPEQIIAQSPPPNAEGVASPKVNLLMTAPAEAKPVMFVMADFIGKPFATASAAVTQGGFKLGAVKYPKGALQKFNFAKDQALNVYTDTVVLHLPVTVEADAPLGEQHIPLKLRYQACNNEVCLPPVTLPVDAVIHVSSGESHPSHPELFAKP